MDLQIDEDLNFSEEPDLIDRWTFDIYQSLSDLHPFCDTANTGTISGEVFADWYGHIEIPQIKYKIVLTNIMQFPHMGIVDKAEVITIIEKFLSIRARCITLFKTNMERMRYRSANATKEDAENEIKEFSKTMEKIVQSCLQQISEKTKAKNEKEHANFLHSLTEEENAIFCRVLFSYKMSENITKDVRLRLTSVISRDETQLKFLTGQRRKQLTKFEKERNNRPKWIPQELSNESVWKYVRGEINSLYNESQPDTELALLKPHQ